VQLVIIDGTNLVHRCRHAQSLQTSRGLETGGLFGSIRSLFYNLKDFPGAVPIVTWDSKSRGRIGLLPGYKSNRAGKYTPMEMRAIYYQLNRTQEAFSYLGIPNIRIYGLEADDIIGWLVAQNPEAQILVVSTDKDMYQLMAGRRVVLIQGDKDMSEKYLMKKKGLTPLQYRLYHAMCGDTSDGIPGVKLVGEKTVKTVIQLLPEDFDYDDPDWEVLREVCAGHKSARVRRMADGVDIVRRNYALVNLLPSPFVTPLHGMMIRSWLTAQYRIQWEEFVGVLVKHEFDSMLEKGLFWMRHDLQHWNRNYSEVRA